MFGIGTGEFLIIAVVAILVVGPEHLPRIMRTVQKVMSDFRRVSTEFQRTLNLEAHQEEYQKRQQAAAPTSKKTTKKKKAPAKTEPEAPAAAPTQEYPAPADESAVTAEATPETTPADDAKNVAQTATDTPPLQEARHELFKA